VLFSNFSDRDGGAITASLDQMGIKYKFSEGGTAALLIPAEQVHDVRLKLAPRACRGGNVGFELLENQKLGVSQFLEQVNYQRSLEGELANSIQACRRCVGARAPGAAEAVRVRARAAEAHRLGAAQPAAGPRLDQAQVSAIVHLVASSVPELPRRPTSPWSTRTATCCPTPERPRAASSSTRTS
jgi:flagellar M-ring protein FliF